MRFGDILGIPKTYLNELFSDSDSAWIDIVKPEHYPDLTGALRDVGSLLTGKAVQTREVPFSLPRSLADFGLFSKFTRIYGDEYREYLEQWSTSEPEIVAQQHRIHSALVDKLPARQDAYIYMLVSDDPTPNRVIYVGKCEQRQGLLKRMLDGKGSPPKYDDYLGGVLSRVGPGTKNALVWRARNAEHRRRGLSRLVWFTVEFDELKEIEVHLIEWKFQSITRNAGVGFRRDPANA